MTPKRVEAEREAKEIVDWAIDERLVPVKVRCTEMIVEAIQRAEQRGYDKPHPLTEITDAIKAETRGYYKGLLRAVEKIESSPHDVAHEPGKECRCCKIAESLRKEAKK